jgi:hypothetical protein
MYTTDSGILLVVGAVVVGAGMLAFNRADAERTSGGGYGSGLRPSSRRALALVIVIVGFGIMASAAFGS